MNEVWILLGALLLVGGIVGSVLPFLPGPPLCYLALLVQPSDAEVELDGVLQGQAGDYDGKSACLVLPQGQHRLGLKRKGYRPQELTVYGELDGRQSMRLELQKE